MNSEVGADLNNLKAKKVAVFTDPKVKKRFTYRHHPYGVCSANKLSHPGL